MFKSFLKVHTPYKWTQIFFNSMLLCGPSRITYPQREPVDTQPAPLGGLPFKVRLANTAAKGNFSTKALLLKAIELPICKNSLKAFFFSFLIARSGWSFSSCIVVLAMILRMESSFSGCLGCAQPGSCFIVSWWCQMIDVERGKTDLPTWKWNQAAMLSDRPSHIPPRNIAEATVLWEKIIEKNLGLPGCISGKEPACQCKRHKRWGLDPWVGRSPEGGHGNPPQYFCLENPMDREAWQATVRRGA